MMKKRKGVDLSRKTRVARRVHLERSRRLENEIRAARLGARSEGNRDQENDDFRATGLREQYDFAGDKMDSMEASNDSQCLSSSSGSPLPRDSQKVLFREGLESKTEDVPRLELKKLSLDEHGTFMMDFDPEKSQRELRKMNRRIHGKGSNKNALYDEKGVFLDVPIDLCDCLSKDCPGCHFPCPKCSSEKCGTDCRCGRRYAFDLIEIEGTDTYYSFPL